MSQSLIDYLSTYNLTLSDVQYKAVTALEGPTALISAPGSGKTTVTVIRLANLIVKGGADPNRVLALTFSKAAARDMGHRFGELFPTLKDRLRFSTIHSLAFSIIKQAGGAYQFLDKPDTLSKRQVISGLYLERFGTYLADYEFEEMAANIGLLKNLLIFPGDTANIAKFVEEDLDSFIQIYEAYELFKESRGLLDFDDILTLGLKILQENSQLRKHYQETFTHVQVDEAQDISTAQWELIKLLALPQNHLFLVGDDDQSIYGFRGADPSIFLKFKEIPQAKIIAMNENYRSSQNLVQMASTFIQANKIRHPKTIVTANGAGVSPVFSFFQRESEQFAYVAEKIQKVEGSVAVLYRQNISVMGLLPYLEIPYQLHEERLGFFSHPVLRDIQAFFQLALNPCDEGAFKRLAKILYLPAITVREVLSQSQLPYLTYLGTRVRFQKAFQKSKAQEFVKHFPKLSQLPPQRGLHYVLMTLGYEEFLFKKGFLKEEKGQPVYTQAKAVLETLRALSKSCETPQQFLEKLSQKPKSTRGAKVHLMTFHSSKGLEFDTVFLVDCMNQITPSNTLEEDGLATYEEERRLFYVAMTRARHRLEILGSANRYAMNFSRSDFFNEAKSAAGVQEILLEKALPKKERSLLESPETLYQDFPIGSAVIHKRFGAGQILERDGEIATISFADEVRRISLRITLEKGVLQKSS